MGEKDILIALTKRVEVWSQQEQVDLIVIRILDHFHIKGILRTLGYLRASNRLSGGPNAIIQRCHQPKNIKLDQVTNSADWYFMDGDSDRP
jgi:hypothetical protein